MKKLFNILASAAIVALGAVSCETSGLDEVDGTVGSSEGFVIYASTPSDSSTRIGFTDDATTGINLAWELNDAFTVYDSDGNFVGNFTCTDATSNMFTSSVTLTNSATYTAIYPATDEATLSDAQARDLTSSQTISEIDDLNTYCSMEGTFTYTDGSDPSFAFAHQNAIVTIKFTSTTAPTSVELQNGSESYTVTTDGIAADSGDTYTVHMMIKPSNATSRTLVFKIGDATYLINSENPHYAGYRYTADLTGKTSVEGVYWTAYAASSFSGSGDGSSADSPYEISTAEELAYLAKTVNKRPDDTDDTYGTDYTGKYFKLTANIDLSAHEWEAIGYYNTYNDYNSFNGIFDGNNKTITGLYINESTGYQGLFRVIVGATITNLTLCGSVTGAGNTGGFVGYSITSESTIKGCHNRCSVTSTGNYVGGIVGNNTYANLTACSNSGAISVTGAYKYYAGGVAGYNSKTITSCYNTGSVTGEGSYVGGVVGNSSGTIESSYNTGSVTGEGVYIGGVAGQNSPGTIESSYNTGSVSGTSYVGGVIGYNYGKSSVLNSYNTGAVTGTSNSVGGVVGYTEASSSGDNTIYNCYNRGSVSGSSIVGGVVGYCKGYYFNDYESQIAYTSYFYLQNCYSAGAVTATSYAGAIAGSINEYSSAKYCYWDSNLCSADGYGYLDLSYTTVDYVAGYTTSDMTTNTTVLNLLNTEANMPSGAVAWKSGDDGYPTLKFD